MFMMPENSSIAPEVDVYTNETTQCHQEPLILYDSIIGIKFAVPQLEAFITGIILVFVILVTIVGNVLVILSVFNYRPLRIAQNFFIVSLAIADLTVAILVLPFNVMYYLMGKWIFGIYLCKMWLTSDVLCCTASILNLCAIALDRYWAITDPINYATKRTLKRVITMIVIIWILSAIISSPPLIGWNDWPDIFDDTTPCKLTSERGYVIYSSLGSFYIPLLIMTTVYVQIYIATRRRLRERARASKMNTFKRMLNKQTAETEISPVENKSTVSGDLEHNGATSPKEKKRKKNKKRRHKDAHSQQTLLVPKNEESASDVQVSPGKAASSDGNVAHEVNGHRKNSQNNLSPGASIRSSNVKKIGFVHQFIEEKQRISLSKERKAARTLGIIMGVFVVCWLPFFIMYVMLSFCTECCVSKKTNNAITWLGYINSSLNPFIYTIFNMDFRKAFKKILHLR